MKPPLSFLAGVLLTSLAWAQPISVAQLIGPDRTVRDADYGVAFVCPPGWELIQASHWGDLQATLYLRASAVPDATPAVYYSVFSDPLEPKDGFEAWLRSQAVNKGQTRARDDGLPDYLNRADSYVVRTIGGCAALSWIGDYTSGGRKWCELLTHVANATGHAQFFVRVPAEKLGDLLPGYEALVTSTRLSAGAVLQTMNPLIVEGRKLYRTKEYPKAVEVFRGAFKAEPIKANDLVIGAGAAALAGERELALTWLRLAVVKGFSETPRITTGRDFVSLHDVDGWKELVASLPARPVVVDTVTDKPLQATLLAILDEDQKYRQQLGEVEKKFGHDSKELRALWTTIGEKDAINLGKVKEILDQQGWVGPETVGRQANSALFLVIQHADHGTQLKYLPMMREAMKNGKAQASSLALLEDRVALRDGRRQIYGSQIGRDNTTGKYFISPLEDPDHVDERRAAVGLQPLADYVKHWEITWDVEAFKKQQTERNAGNN